MSHTKITPYLTNIKNWQSIVQNKWILFDSDAIIALTKNNTLGVFDDFQELGVICCTIHPVYVELLATKFSNERTIRQAIIDSNNFNILPLRAYQLEKSRNIQIYLERYECFPSPTDLYLAGMLATFKNNNKILLLTGDLSHFHSSIFNREAYLVLQNEKQCRVLCFLSLDNDSIWDLPRIFY